MFSQLNLLNRYVCTYSKTSGTSRAGGSSRSNGSLQGNRHTTHITHHRKLSVFQPYLIFKNACFHRRYDLLHSLKMKMKSSVIVHDCSLIISLNCKWMKVLNIMYCNVCNEKSRLGHLQPHHGFRVCQQRQQVQRVQEHQQVQRFQESRAHHGHPDTGE